MMQKMYHHTNRETCNKYEINGDPANKIIFACGARCQPLTLKLCATWETDFLGFICRVPKLKGKNT